MRRLQFLIAILTMLLASFSPQANAQTTVNGALVKSRCPNWQTQVEQIRSEKTNSKVITARHRGAFDKQLPENSLGAFLQAFDQCRPVIETDVRMTADGVPVIFHDTNIGKMLRKDYDPESNEGPNERLNSLKFGELKSLRLVRPDRTETSFEVPSVEELVDFTLQHEGQSVIQLEIKEKSAFLATLKVLDEKEREYAGRGVLERFMVKFSMNEAPTPQHFENLLRQSGIENRFTLMPKINPGIAMALNSGEQLDDPPQLELGSNASRAVGWWSAASRTQVPIVEVNLKDASEFLRTEREVGSRFGAFERPVNVALDNVKKGTVGEYVAVVHFFGKKLGAFVPVPDFVMFTPGPAAGYTVPNTFGDKKPIPATDAFFNNDSSCCYRLTDRRQATPIAEEKHDWRENLDFLRAVGANFLTADDTDSIDLYAFEQGYLNLVSRPAPVAPPKDMNSSLYYKVKDRAVPDRAIVRIEGWDGRQAAAWGGKVCLWTSPNNSLWTVKCDYKDEPYSNRLQIETVGDSYMRIRDPKSLQCVYSTPNVDDRIAWSADCNSDRALWRRTNKHRFVDVDGREINFQWDDRYSYGNPFAYNYLSRGDTSTWSQWKLVPQ
ncbi:hypothetical protein HMPREF2635_06170 [Corynebacterium sp. HMSC035E02]|uniref:glycerophosphodiester phosphodiesterase family protein n=2 Tax=Corynebacteriaceae TaxID=1653 RepID=UPI0006696DCF|nr:MULTISPECIES: glycerophosphodiester phosphodiesterase family protein [Corynebacterium]OHO55351.1 hypothetical protein HMPREF2635_06170 [Corynebacterium sp. HMSC035E02]